MNSQCAFKAIFYDPDKISWLLTGVENGGKRVQLCLA